MSVSKSKYQSELFTHLPFDVIGVIVKKLTFPEMRSVASTNKSLRNYLIESWHLDEKIIARAAKSIASDRFPFVRIINRAEKMTAFATVDQIGLFLSKSKRALEKKTENKLLGNSKSWIIASTIVSTNAAAKFHDGLQHKLLSLSGWDTVDKKYIDTITELIDFSSIRTIPGKIRVKEIIDTIAVFPNQAKAYGFIRLISQLCWHQEFNKDFGAFWRGGEGGISEYFLANASKLLPDQWNSWLTDFHGIEYIGKDRRKHYFSFTDAVQICTQNMGGDSPGFSVALLKLLMSSVDHFEPDRRTWKCLKKQLKKEKEFDQLKQIQIMLEGLFSWGMRDDDLMMSCKKILCDSRFFSEKEWKKFIKHRGGK